MTDLTYITIQLVPSKSRLQSQWLRAVNSQEYRSSLIYFSRKIKAAKVSYWLADLTRLSSPNLHDQQWTAELIGSTVRSAKLKKIALVLPDDLFLEVVIEKIGEKVLQKTGNQVQISSFNNFQQACNWLESQIDIEGLFRQDGAID